ncbi:MAG: TolC family protein [Meiothermus sp.]|nr:TolC family protein [Meiothermus sp.]
MNNERQDSRVRSQGQVVSVQSAAGSGKVLLLALTVHLFAFAPFHLSIAQAQPITLTQALNQSFSTGPDMSIARANLAQAQANRKAQEADPSSPEDLLVRVRNAERLAQVRVEQAQRETLQNVLGVYLGIAEVQQSLEVLLAQVTFNGRNLEVARSRLGNKVGTPLDVSRAENTLAGSRQLVANTQSQLPVLTTRLETLLGLNANANPAVVPLGEVQERPLDLRTLSSGLLDRLPSVVEVRNGLVEAELAVKLTDNDYTPELTKREALTLRNNARLGLRAAEQAAAANLADAFRAALDAQQQIQIRSRDLANASEGHRQNQIRLNAGTISGLQLQGSELELRSARLQLVQAQYAYLRALAALSVAAGQDVTGLVK